MDKLLCSLNNEVLNCNTNERRYTHSGEAVLFGAGVRHEALGLNRTLAVVLVSPLVVTPVKVHFAWMEEEKEVGGEVGREKGGGEGGESEDGWMEG